MKNIVLLIFILCSHLAVAQGTKIKGVKETVSGTDAFNAPIDSNGHPCGLVKVLATISDLTFDGDIVGEVENKMNEYHVYLAQGSQRLVIKRPYVLPLVVHFPDYGIEEIASKAAYLVTVGDQVINKEKNGIIIDVKPRNAKVHVDDTLIDNPRGDGAYMLYLPKGSYAMRVEQEGYRSFAQIMNTGKGTQNLNIELESVMADVDISCKTPTAELFVNNDMVGTGGWKGQLPAGTYTITAKLEGFIEETQTILLEEKESRAISFPQLKRAQSRFVAITNPEGGTIFVDGVKVDDAAKGIDITTGEHIVRVTMPFGFQILEEVVEIRTGEENRFEFKPKLLNALYESAFNGDYSAQYQIIQKVEEIRNEAPYNILTEYDIEIQFWSDKLYSELELMKTKMDKETLNPFLDMLGFFYSKYYRTGNNYNPEKLVKILSMMDDPDSRTVAECYQDIGDYDNAIIWYKKNINKNQEQYSSTFGYNNYYSDFTDLAYIYELKGEKEEAIHLYTMVYNYLKNRVIFDRNNTFIAPEYIAIADACLRLGARKEAIEIYKAYLQILPSEKLKQKLKEIDY